MKMRYVYALISHHGQVEYVGETKDLKWRLYDHTQRPRGKFYGREDLHLVVLSEHESRVDSYQAQCNWQENFGLPTDHSKHTAGLAKARMILKDLGFTPLRGKRKGTPLKESL